MKSLNSQLDLRKRHPDFQRFLDVNERESERVRQEYACQLDVKYGSAELQGIDIFPSEKTKAPILVFIHGGYWKALDKKSYRFIAEPFVNNHFSVCLINYRLLPKVSMEETLNDIKDALEWIRTEATTFNGNPDNLLLSGHSAGGHLALMVYLLNEHLRPSVKAICSLSGLFDLHHIRESYLNETLQLDQQVVDNFSPMNMDLSVLKCPVLISVGANETGLFIEQSKKLWSENRAKAPLEYYEYPKLNHYEIVHQLGKENNPLTSFLFTHQKED